MQFILYENAKHILNEKYILLESPEDDKADLEKGLPELLENVKKIITELKPKADKFKETASKIKELKTISEPFENDVKGLTGDFTIFAGKAKEYINKLQDFIKANSLDGAEFPEITHTLDKLLTGLNSSPAKEKETTRIRNEVITDFKDLVNIVTEQLQGAKSDFDENKLIAALDSLEKFISGTDKAQSFTDAIANLKNPAIVNDSTVENLSMLLLEAEASIPDELSSGEDLVLSETLVNTLSHLVETCTALLTALCTEPKPKSDLQQARDKNNSKLDWRKEFEDVGSDREGIAAIWKKYFETEWGNNAEFVKALGEPFVMQLQKLGYNANVNPFITFVQLCIEKQIPLNGKIMLLYIMLL